MRDEGGGMREMINLKSQISQMKNVEAVIFHLRLFEI